MLTLLNDDDAASLHPMLAKARWCCGRFMTFLAASSAIRVSMNTQRTPYGVSMLT